MKSPAELRVDLARIIEMKSAESKAVVDQQMAVVDIQRVHGDGKALAEILSGRQIELRVAGQVWIGELRIGRSVRKPRAVVKVSRHERLPRQIGHGTEVKGVALIVIERAPSGRRRHSDDQATGERSLRLRHLIGISEMNLRTLPQTRRT